jgi:hypothetical protein
VAKVPISRIGKESHGILSKYDFEWLYKQRANDDYPFKSSVSKYGVIMQNWGKINWIVSVFVLFGCVRVNVISKSQDKFELSPRAAELYEEIKKMYGKAPRIVWVDSADPYYGGQSDVFDDGIPRIRVSYSSKAPETTVVHEMYHLLWRFRGIPTRYIPANQGNVMLSESTLQSLNEIFTEVSSRISHAIFFPSMRQIGFDPSVQYRSFGLRVLDSGDIDKITEPWVRINFLLWLINESQDEDLVKRAKIRFRKLGATVEISRAEYLVDLMKKRVPQDGQSAVDLFVDIVNQLLIGKAYVKFVQWSDEKKGFRFIDRGAVILVSPVR